MKLTIEIQGNDFESLCEICQTISDESFAGKSLDEMDFDVFENLVDIYTEEDEEDEEEDYDGISYQEQVRRDFVDGIRGI